jgi:hypothetical protein
MEDLTDEEYEKEKAKVLAMSKNKGLDLWEAIFKNYDLDIEKAKTFGVDIPNIGFMQLYFNDFEDKWLLKPVAFPAN